MRLASRFGSGAKWATLLSLLALYGVLGRYAPYLVLLIIILIVPYLVFTRRPGPLAFGMPEVGFVAAFSILAVAFWLSSQQPSDPLIVVNFIWLLLFIPLQALLRRHASHEATAVVAQLALLGTFLLLLLALYEHLVLGSSRVGELTSDPIRIANTGVILGCLSLMGILAGRERSRFVYLLGPALALAIAFLAGTRGAIASLCVICVFASLFLVPSRRVAALVAGAVAAACVAALLTAAWMHVPRIDSLIATLTQLWHGDIVTDASAHIRLSMQRAALGAFLERPWFGHGWQRIMAAAAAHLPPAEMELFNGQPHLHDDLANFAVAGGVLGLLSYGLVVVSPVVAALRSGHDALRHVRVFGAAVLTASYIVLGLNSLMFGYEVHTALFCGLTAILLGFCREQPSRG